MKESKTLIVKHFSSVIPLSAREEFLKLFGAKTVRCMPDDGKFKCTAFASFESSHDAKVALSRLHQLELLDKKLVVEFAKQEIDFPPPSNLPSEFNIQGEQSVKASEKENLRVEIEKFSKNLHGTCPSLGLDYIPFPLLKYKYPPPTPTIIGNISHALAAVPKFYTQVLHLMNKMNLPAPFGPLTSTPPLTEDQPLPSFRNEETFPQNLQEEDFVEVNEMDTSSNEESELETDEDVDRHKTEVVLPFKRPKEKTKKHRKKPKFHLLPAIPAVTYSGPRTEPSEIFESQPHLDSQKKILFNIKPTLDPTVATHSNVDKLEGSSVQEEGGFGILMAPKTDNGAQDVNEEFDDEDLEVSEFISMRELRKKRLSHREMKTLSIFRNYSPGEPTVRLYIKNLARQVEEKDLRYVFGRFIDRNAETDRNMFDVRLMKEGRMKGQAFVTLANEEQAKQAVRETNGFILHTKPLVVQFARSAKPKDAPTTRPKRL